MKNLVINFTETDNGMNTLILSRTPGEKYHQREYARFKSIEAAVQHVTKNKTARGFRIQEVFPDVFQAQGTIQDDK